MLWKKMKNKPYYKVVGSYAPEDLKGSLLHRYIYEKFWGIKIPSDCCIHHFDFNPDNNDILNLVMMTKHDHQSYHSKLLPRTITHCHNISKGLIGNKNSLGHHHLEETKKKIGIASKKRWNKHA